MLHTKKEKVMYTNSRLTSSHVILIMVYWFKFNLSNEFIHLSNTLLMLLLLLLRLFYIFFVIYVQFYFESDILFCYYYSSYLSTLAHTTFKYNINNNIRKEVIRVIYQVTVCNLSQPFKKFVFFLSFLLLCK